MANHPNRALEREFVARAFASRLREDDLHDVLLYLNGLTDYRFTGVYRLTPGWTVSVALCDRENPQLRLGANVKMTESYCWLTGVNNEALVIEDAPNDVRLGGHAARDAVRSYAAVLLRDVTRAAWGTLCHFDFSPRLSDPQTIAQLDIMRPLLEEMFVRDRAAPWHLEALSGFAEPVDQARLGGISFA
ncbi:MAG TPA: hypothetical protein VGM50_22355 [Gemmatimonadaceae bacterium]|jgi:hypothetical protein